MWLLIWESAFPWPVISFLRMRWVLHIAPEQPRAAGGLEGKTFCITGKLLHYPNRDALVADIEKNGGKVVSGVSAKTDYLITNDKDSGSSKNQKAAKFGTKIISEDEFLALIAGGEA